MTKYFALICLLLVCIRGDKNQQDENTDDGNDYKSVLDFFKELDTSKDGEVTIDEVEKFLANRGYTGKDLDMVVTDFMETYDQNKDHALTVEEFVTTEEKQPSENEETTHTEL